MNISLRVRPVLIFIVILSGMVVGEAVPSRRVEAGCPTFPKPCNYDPTKEDPPFFAEDDRVNPSDPVAPMTAYCKADHSIDVWGINNSKGIYLFTASEQQIKAALAAAARNGNYVLIQEREGRQLIALAPGDLLLHDYGGYDFRFSAASCGLNVNSSNPGGNTSQAPAPNVQPAAPAPVMIIVQPANQPVTLLTTRGRLKVRLTPSVNGDVIDYLSSGVKVSILGRDATRNWLKISYNGLQGWVVATNFGMSVADLLNLPVVR